MIIRSALDSRGMQELKRPEPARHILDQEFEDPPSLLELSREAGLNDFKLKRGFRQAYNTTVFGYVRRLRMEKARALLESGDFNVTEAAIRTGYNCLSHFSAAFKKHFGFLPGMSFKNSFLSDGQPHPRNKVACGRVEIGKRGRNEGDRPWTGHGHWPGYWDPC